MFRFRTVSVVAILLISSILLSSCVGTIIKAIRKGSTAVITRYGDDATTVITRHGDDAAEQVGKQVTKGSDDLVTNGLKPVIKQGSDDIAEHMFSPAKLAVILGQHILIDYAIDQTSIFLQQPRSEANIEIAMNTELTQIQETNIAVITDTTNADEISSQIYRHESLAFGFRLESDFSAKSSDINSKDQSFTQTFINNDIKSPTELMIRFLIAGDTALSDSEWESFLQKYTADFPDTVNISDNPVILHGQTWGYLTKNETYFVKEWVAENGGVIFLVKYATPYTRWQSHQSQILSTMQSIQWDANIVRELITESG